MPNNFGSGFFPTTFYRKKEKKSIQRVLGLNPGPVATKATALTTITTRSWIVELKATEVALNFFSLGFKGKNELVRGGCIA